MTSPKSPPARLPLIENINAVEIIADDIPFICNDGANVTLCLTRQRFDNSSTPGTLQRVVVARLSLPVATAMRLPGFMYSYLVEIGAHAEPQPPEPVPEGTLLN